MQSAAEAGNHLLDLINRVLDLSKIDSLENDLDVENYDMVPLLESAISISKPLADVNGIALEYISLQKNYYFAKVDPLRIKQVMLNLISNAIKYNKPKGSVTVSFKQQENGNLRLGVQDTGYGIVEKDREKIFMPFERLNVKDKNIEGAGIGLAISKKYIQLMGGTLGFESVEGGGSFFYIDIPVSEGHHIQSNI